MLGSNKNNRNMVLESWSSCIWKDCTWGFVHICVCALFSFPYTKEGNVLIMLVDTTRK